MTDRDTIQNRISGIKKNNRDLERMIQTGRNEIAELEKELKSMDESRSKHQVKQKIESLHIKSNSVVMALRNIGHQTTAGPICKELGRLGIKKLHNSEFAAFYMESVKSDNRIIITQVSASKFKYALREWKK